MKKLNILIILMSLLLVLSVNAADVSKTWTCDSGLSGCSANSCVLARDMQYNTVNLYFNTPSSGDYDCSLTIKGTDYGNDGSAQILELEKVSLNGNVLGYTNDCKCNYGSGCHDCGPCTSNFGFDSNLVKNDNVIKLTGYQSHSIYSVSISCDENVVCGDGDVDSGEDCELPSTNNNAYCTQSTTKCSDNKLGTRDALGNCNSGCGCTYDSFSYSCVAGSCGATCDSNDDCNDQNEHTIDTCNADCGCEYEQLSYCGDSIVDSGEECDAGNKDVVDGIVINV